MVPRVLTAVVLITALGTFVACAPAPSDPSGNAEGISAKARLEVSGSSQAPTCASDSKLIGRVSVFGDENEESWWRLTYNGMIAGGLTTPDEQRDYLNGALGTTFATLAEVRLFNLQAISDGHDKNQNGFVCALEIRGTHAWNKDPLFGYTWFGISDDKDR